ncbi:MAG: hypothetical protein ACETWQ_16940 [Phycisphaerae bacterium]
MSEKKFVKALLCLVVALSFSATGALGDNILFIVNADRAGFSNDTLIGDFLESLGHTVTYFDDTEDEAATEAAAAAADLVWISESIGSSNVANEITEIEVPMVVGEPYCWDEMGMTRAGGSTSDVATTDITIVSPGHFLAAGLSGTVPVLTDIAGSAGTAQFANGDAGGDATVIATATLADGQTYDVILVYEKGAALAVPAADGSGPFAADLRIGMFFHYYAHDVLNDNAYALMEAAVKYVLGVKTQARNPDPRDRSLYADTWATLSWSPGDLAVSHDVYFGDNFDDVNDGAEGTFQGNQTSTFLVVGFPGFPFPDGLVPGMTYYWRIDEINENEPNSPWKGNVWSFSIPPKTAYGPDPADGAESVEADVQLSWTGGFGSKLHTVYFGDNFDDVDNAAGGLPQGTTTYTPGALKLAKTYYWRVDEFDAIETHKGNVWSFTTEGGVGSPDPSNGAVDIKQTPILTWTPGAYAASHQVYFGTDKEAVRNADTGSPEYKGTGDLGAESFDPGKLEWNTTYYWRIDEANDVNPDSPWTGNVWSFTTANFLIVDDFESYNDIDPPDPASNRIFEAWLDGYDDPTNGALVGNDLPPYAEQSIVHGGIQSMPYFYDNSVGNSEATHTLTYPRDWTEKGVNTLTIWFRGNSANAAENLYVVLNGSAVVNHDNPNAAQTGTWTEWIIDLQAFGDQGVNLANVNTIGIGFGNRNNPLAGGSGTMYFDDIRLYPPPPTP